MLKYIREQELDRNQIKVLEKYGFVVCFKEISVWGKDLYSVYAWA